jgi:hypothetical protein
MRRKMMQVPDQVNGVPVKKNVRGFIKDLEKFMSLKEKYFRDLEIVERKYGRKMYQLKIKLEDRRDRFTGTCKGQVERLTGVESLKDVLTIE